MLDKLISRWRKYVSVAFHVLAVFVFILGSFTPGSGLESLLTGAVFLLLGLQFEQGYKQEQQDARLQALAKKFFGGNRLDFIDDEND